MATADPVLAALADELRGYPSPGDEHPDPPPPDGNVYVPLQLRTLAGGRRAELHRHRHLVRHAHRHHTSEPALEAFFAADDDTAQALPQMAEALR